MRWKDLVTAMMVSDHQGEMETQQTLGIPGTVVE